MTKEQLNSRSTKIDEIQSNQYSFPYHYIPTYDGFPNFSKEWSFSPSYLAAIKLFQEWLKIEVQSSTSHRHDFGCGMVVFYNVNRKILIIGFYGNDIDKGLYSELRYLILNQKLH